jgi:hypothetical protein
MSKSSTRFFLRVGPRKTSAHVLRRGACHGAGLHHSGSSGDASVMPRDTVGPVPSVIRSRIGSAALLRRRRHRRICAPTHPPPCRTRAIRCRARDRGPLRSCPVTGRWIDQQVSRPRTGAIHRGRSRSQAAGRPWSPGRLRSVCEPRRCAEVRGGDGRRITGPAHGGSTTCLSLGKRGLSTRPVTSQPALTICHTPGGDFRHGRCRNALAIVDNGSLSSRRAP